MKIQCDIDIQEDIPSQAAGLVWPVPPNTHFQRMLTTTHKVDKDIKLKGLNTDQCAYFRPARYLQYHRPLSVQYQIELGAFAPAAAHFNLNQSSHLALTDDVYRCIDTLLKRQEMGDPEFLSQVIAALAEHFHYLHHEDELNRAELVCTHLQGDCLDINTVLMKLLKTRAIETAYYIGLYFESQGNHRMDDWHCWVSTQIDGLQDWDIAHHLKRGLHPVKPALNPVAGVRFALSHGRGSEYLINNTIVEFSHLGSPYWCFNDGSTRQVRFNATLSHRLQAQEVMC